MSVKIIVDSTADMSAQAKAKVSAVVPLSVRFGEEEFKDGVTITPQKFYEMLAEGKELPTTSQPTPALFEEIYEEATADGSEVVMITISSRLSGTYQSATIAAEDYEGKVFVVDSRSAALGTGVLAEYALQLAEQGMSGQQILETLMEKRSKVRLYAVLDTLEYLKKGGRINSATAVVGGMLNIKPMICTDDDGRIAMAGTARGLKKAFSMLNENCEKNGGVDRSMPTVVAYTGRSDENMRKYLEENAHLWPSDTNTTIVGATVGVHAGPGAVAVGFFSAE